MFMLPNQNTMYKCCDSIAITNLRTVPETSSISGALRNRDTFPRETHNYGSQMCTTICAGVNLCPHTRRGSLSSNSLTKPSDQTAIKPLRPFLQSEKKPFCLNQMVNSACEENNKSSPAFGELWPTWRCYVINVPKHTLTHLSIVCLSGVRVFFMVGPKPISHHAC